MGQGKQARVNGRDFRGERLCFSSLLESVSDVVMIMEEDGNVVYASLSAERSFGYRAEDLCGTNVFAYVHREDVDPASGAISRILDGSETESVAWLRFCCSDGTWLDTYGSLSNRLGDPGVQGLVLTLRDGEASREGPVSGRVPYEALVRNAMDLMTICDGDNTIRYASPSVRTILGYEPEELIGVYVPDLVHPDDLAYATEQAARVVDKPTVRGAPVRYRRKDGSWVYLESVMANLLADPEVAGVLVNSRDVTIRVRAEEEIQHLSRNLDAQVPQRTAGLIAAVAQMEDHEPLLRERAESLRNIFEHAAVGIVQLGKDGEWLMVNRRFCEMTAYPREELFRRTFRDLVHPDDRDNDLEEMERLSAGEIRTYSVEKRCVREDGHVVWMELTTSLVREHSGGAKCYVLIAEDITERKRSQAALRQSDEHYRAVVEQATEGIFLVDSEDKRILESNAAFQEVLGYDSEELSRKTLYDLMVGDDERVDMERHVGRALAERGCRIGEERYRRKDGSLVDVEINARTIRYDGRDVLCCVARDVTERKAAEASLKRHLDMVLALHEANRTLSSTLEVEEIASRLLEIMRRVSDLHAAGAHMVDGERWTSAGRTVGSEALWRRAREAQASVSSRRAVLREERPASFALSLEDHEGQSLVGVCLPLKTRNSVMGVVEAYGPESLAEDDTIEILASLAGQAASALENARLYEQLGEREQRLQDLVGKLLTTQEEERRRVAYEVHDGLAQVAVAAHQHLQVFARRHHWGRPQSQKDLGHILKLVRSTVTESRRIIAHLRPTVLDDLGLASAIALEVENLRDSGYRVEFEEKLGDERLPAAAEIALFRVMQEALTNMRKHAQAERVYIRLWRENGWAYAELRDWGRGFDLKKGFIGKGPGERMGLSGMRERVMLLGGEFDVRSWPGAGTAVVAGIPL